MTRNADYFVNLNRRVAIARENEAHLLISIHADAFTTPQPRGGSVYSYSILVVLTPKSRVGLKTKRNNLNFWVGAVRLLPTTLTIRTSTKPCLDLQFSHSQKEGYKLATAILFEMGKVAKLHNS